VYWVLSYRSDRYCTQVRPIEPTSEQVRSTGLVRPLYRVLEMFFGYVRSWTRHVRWTIWPLEFELYRTCLAPLRTCPDPNPNLPSKGVFFSECPEPVWGYPTGLTIMVDQSALTAPTVSFPDSYKRHFTPSLVGYWFLTVWITFQQTLELPPTSLCEIQVICRRFLSWVESLCVSTRVQALSTLGCVNHSWIICYSWRWSLLDG
jgi:hypothetical protein